MEQIENIKIEDIFFDEKLYPRTSYDWKTAYNYSNNIEAGARFPPIELAELEDKKLYLVDGKHRIEAYKILHREKIPAIIHKGWSKAKIFEESIKFNNTHGKPLNAYEKRIIAVKLMEMKMKQSKISELIQVPQGKLQNFVSQRMVNVITGKEISPSGSEGEAQEVRKIVKSGLKHLAGKSFTEEDMRNIETSQETLKGYSQRELLKAVLELIEKNLIDMENEEIKELVEKLREELNHV